MTERTCPEVSRWVEFAAAELSVAEHVELERHAVECPVCRIELELAREFAAPTATLPGASSGVAEVAEVAYIVAGLERRFGSGTHAGRTASPAARQVLEFRPRLRQASRFAPWAAAAVLVLAVGYMATSRGLGTLPSLPDPQNEGPVRSVVFEARAPRGELSGAPAEASVEFIWARLPAAAIYRVTLADVTDRVLWSGTARAAEPRSSDSERLELPEAVRRGLVDRVRYRWRVEALDGAGAPIRESDWADFRWKGRP